MSQIDDKQTNKEELKMIQNDGKRFNAEESKMGHFDGRRVNEALEILEAAARDSKQQLTSAMENKYTNLTSMLGSITGQIGHRVSEGYAMGKQRAVDAAVGVDKSVHNRPWAYIGGTAAGAMLVGYLMGRSRRK